jgi:hypothetical protein
MSVGKGTEMVHRDWRPIRNGFIDLSITPNTLYDDIIHSEEGATALTIISASDATSTLVCDGHTPTLSNGVIVPVTHADTLRAVDIKRMLDLLRVADEISDRHYNFALSCCNTGISSSRLPVIADLR